MTDSNLIPENDSARKSVRYGWGLKWRSENKLDGKTEYLIVGNHMGNPVMPTRQTARAYREYKYGYIRDRKDLQDEPHGWKMPQVVKVRVTIEEV